MMMTTPPSVSAQEVCPTCNYWIICGTNSMNLNCNENYKISSSHSYNVGDIVFADSWIKKELSYFTGYENQIPTWRNEIQYIPILIVHRIKAVENVPVWSASDGTHSRQYETRYILQGDNNLYPDWYHPLKEDVKFKLEVH